MERATFSLESISGVYAFASLHSLVAGVDTFVYLLLTFRVLVLAANFSSKMFQSTGCLIELKNIKFKRTQILERSELVNSRADSIQSNHKAIQTPQNPGM